MDIPERDGTVVVGVDGSPESRSALRFALEEAARRGARVQVVEAFTAPEYWATAYGLSGLPDLDELTERAERHARSELAAVLGEQDGPLTRVPADVVAVPGAPGRVLAESALGADLLVIGHRGRGALASATLGSVGLHCVLHAPCPVTVVRPDTAQEHPAEHAGAQPGSGTTRA